MIQSILPGRLFELALLSMLIRRLIALSFYRIACGSPGIDLGFAETHVMMVVIFLLIAQTSVPGRRARLGADDGASGGTLTLE